MKVISLGKRGGRRPDPRPIVTINRTCRLNSEASLLLVGYETIDIAVDGEDLYVIVPGNRRIKTVGKYLCFTGSGIPIEYFGKYSMNSYDKGIFKLTKVA